MTATRDERPPDGWADEFTTICDSHRGRLVRWLTSIFGPRDAEDIAQEALTRLYVRPGLLDQDADAWPWLAVVARNVGRDMARHNALSTTVDATFLDQLPDDARVHDQVVARDDAERLALALRRISARDRALLHLRDVEGMPVGDLATRLGLNDNAVRQQLFRARKRLANAYVELGGDRRAGLALAFTRVREFARRHARFAEPLGTFASGAFASALPALAGIAGGLLIAAVTGGGAAGPAGAGDAGPLSGPPSGRAPAVAGPAAAGRIAAAARGGPRPSPSPFLTVDEEVGPVRAGGWTRDPLDNRPGPGQQWSIVVDLPIVGPYEIEVWDYSEGPGPVCRTLGCPTAIPTPPDGR
ncbi:MAG TPA: sigma-70 family RNA polymerase sigma factor [Frankiaceae bacterium]|nr:sigma-70 family RNA polymerase sigma factor [Frankiaceae bacterium]